LDLRFFSGLFPDWSERKVKTEQSEYLMVFLDTGLARNKVDKYKNGMKMRTRATVMFGSYSL
jgi:hypothetical protein